VARSSTTFTAGRSGNPGGRPKAAHDVQELARGYGPAGIIKLAELAGLTDAPGAASETAQIAALNALLDRGFGKPTQPLAADAEMPAVIQFRWAPAAETLETPRLALTIDGGDADDAGGEPLRVVWSSD
jgi:hypothetical protein